MMGIYKFTNTVNGKCYVGQSIDLHKRYGEHRRNHLNENYVGYDSKFYNALRKYGFDSFDYEVLVETHDRAELNELEARFIKEFDSCKDGYNLTSGGDFNPSHDPEIVRKRTLKLLRDKEINDKLRHIGEENPNASLLEEDVVQIRTLYGKGADKTEVFNLFKEKVSLHGFNAVWWNRNWKNICQEVYEARPLANRGGSKLQVEDVREMRRLYEVEGKTVNEIHSMYQPLIGKEGVRKIVRYKTWKDVL